MTNKPHKPNFFSRRLIMGSSIGASLVFFMAGIIFWGGFNTAMETTNTLEFCISCHEMKDTVYQEYKPTIHHSNRTGVRATCSDCHVPDPWVHKMVRKVQASKEVVHKVLGTIDTPEKFDKHRLELAKNVWKTMKETDSRECRNCHNFESMNPAHQKPRARKQHLNAFKTGQTCIDCHKGIAHKNIRDQLSDEELEALEKPNPDFIRKVPEIYLTGLKEAEKAEAEEKAQKEKAEAAIKARIDKAVTTALDAQKTATTSNEKSTDKKTTSASTTSSQDWRKVPSRTISIFYPGQSSMEWVLTGKDHGGARPFTKMGDRCFDCHEKEIEDMGKKIVTGEKLEPKETLIPEKRGSFPVTIQASHDDEYLYMKFEWEQGTHTPAPFVEGGKMDPDNSMKLAIMFANDKVKYAKQAGCWGTCHHDLNTMPHAPTDNKVTKYITESRSKIEVKGKNKAKRGGWDKLKPTGDLETEMGKKHFMDIIRYKSGKSEIENGHILAERTMKGGQALEFIANLNGNRWVVEMKRKLVSDKVGDVSFDLSKVYNFGFAIHDDYTSARFHHVSLGYRLGFDNEEAEVNAVKK